MKICIITNTFSADLIGGSNIYTSTIVRELRARNHEIIVIASQPGRKDSVKTLDVVKIYYFHPLNIATCAGIGKKSILWQGIWTLLDIYNPYSYVKILKILRKENPDVVHMHTPLDTTLSAFDAVKRLKLPLAFTAHDHLLLCRRIALLHPSGKICTNLNVNMFCRVYRMLTKAILASKPNVVLFPSHYILQAFLAKNFFKGSKKTVLPYPVQLNNAGSSENKVYLNNKKLNILYVGGLTAYKGIHILIEAVKRIKNDNISLMIIGAGRYKDKLEDLAKEDKRIIFTGRIRNEDIAGYYDRSDLLVLPSVFNEILGIVILEAFRAGLPVAASSIGGIPEVVKPGYNGFLFEPGNIDQLKSILENILENPQSLAELGNNAKKFVKQYEVSGHIGKLISHYEEAIRLNKG